VRMSGTDHVQLTPRGWQAPIPRRPLARLRAGQIQSTSPQAILRTGQELHYLFTLWILLVIVLCSYFMVAVSYLFLA